MTQNVYAMSPVHGHKYSRGVGNACYYIDSTANSYSIYVHGAADNWEVTGYGWNPIYMTYVSSSWATHVDVYGTGTFEPYQVAYTIRYTSSNLEVYPQIQDWFYAKISVNSTLYNSLTEFNKRGTMKHEFGHCFGLAENYNDIYSIMCQLSYGRVVNNVAQEDHDAINYLY